MEQKYIAYYFRTETDFEVFQAFLAQFELESMLEDEAQIIAYVKEENQNNFEAGLKSLESQFEFEVNKEAVINKNWNEEWESSFEPVIVNNFCCIKADFHDIKPKVEHIITINPKMAFGTGHHETTHMMIEAMSELDINDKSVFDFGTGTGILALLAEKLGAKFIYGIDHDPMAIENAIENKEKNKLSLSQFRQQDYVTTPDTKYDIVLANINRAVLLENVRPLSFILSKRGCLLVSGILEEDAELIINTYVANGFKFIDKNQKGEWMCLKFSM